MLYFLLAITLILHLIKYGIVLFIILTWFISFFCNWVVEI